MATTAVQSNAMPVAGTTAQQPVPPSNAPMDLETIKAALKPAIESFREQSSPLSVVLPSTNFTAQATSDGGVKLANVGLGYRTVTEWTGTITLSNTNAAAQTVQVSPWFPYNCIANTNININGGAVTYSTSGLGGLFVALRNGRQLSGPLWSEASPFGPALPQALVRVSVTGSGVTTTNSTVTTPSLSGLASITIPATTGVATITLTWYTFEKLAFDRDTLLGALPLQNNSTYAVKTHTLNTFLGGNAFFPFYQSGGPVSGVTNSAVNLTETTEYDYWSVPSNAALYQEMVNNSYQVQEQTSQTITATGSKAFAYNIPQNMFLIAAHVIARDGSTTQQPLVWNAFQNTYMQYNAGAIVPVVAPRGQYRAIHYLDYGRDDFQFPGYFFWDGEETTESLTNADQAGWIDCYAAASPQLLYDVASTVTTPINFSVVREQLVVGAVQVVGG